ncbi:MAG: hypothetical protein O2904_03325 [bacterium]|nr:hypothetical protein [bacterium]
MSDSTKTNKRQSHSFGAIAKRGALPLFIFSAVLLGTLTFSWLSLLPELTTVEVAGEMRDAKSLQSYHASLTAQISDAQEQRNALILPMEGTQFRALTELKHMQFPLFTLQTEIEKVATRVRVEDEKRAVYLSVLQYSPEENTVDFSGSVRNVGPRSMTVLAQFVEELRSMDFVADLVSPSFTRNQNEDGSFYSPFHIQITLP